MSEKIGSSGGRTPSEGANGNRGGQPKGGIGRVKDIRGGYQAPTGGGAPANPPSGGSSGKKK